MTGNFNPNTIQLVPGNPNITSRSGTNIDAIVVHNTGGSSLAGAVRHLTTANTQHITAHYVIGKDGKIVQLTPDTGRANHAAGTSDLLIPQTRGYRGHANYRSIGIELVNRGNGKDEFPEAQH